MQVVLGLKATVCPAYVNGIRHSVGAINLIRQPSMDKQLSRRLVALGVAAPAESKEG